MDEKQLQALVLDVNSFADSEAWETADDWFIQ